MRAVSHGLLIQDQPVHLIHTLIGRLSILLDRGLCQAQACHITIAEMPGIEKHATQGLPPFCHPAQVYSAYALAVYTRLTYFAFEFTRYAIGELGCSGLS